MTLVSSHISSLHFITFALLFCWISWNSQTKTSLWYNKLFYLFSISYIVFNCNISTLHFITLALLFYWIFWNIVKPKTFPWHNKQFYLFSVRYIVCNSKILFFPSWVCLVLQMSMSNDPWNRFLVNIDINYYELPWLNVACFESLLPQMSGFYQFIKVFLLKPLRLKNAFSYLFNGWNENEFRVWNKNVTLQ